MEIEVKGCPGCPLCNLDDESNSAWCQATPRHIGETPLFKRPDWCPLNQGPVTIRAKEMNDGTIAE